MKRCYQLFGALKEIRVYTFRYTIPPLYSNRCMGFPLFGCPIYSSFVWFITLQAAKGGSKQHQDTGSFRQRQARLFFFFCHALQFFDNQALYIHRALMASRFPVLNGSFWNLELVGHGLLRQACGGGVTAVLRALEEEMRVVG